MFGKSIFAAFFLVLISAGAGFPEEPKSLRQKLFESESVAALYTIDGYFTMIKITPGVSEKDFSNELRGLCISSGGEVEGHGQDDPYSVNCKGGFETLVFFDETTPKSREAGKYLIISHESMQPLIYKSQAVAQLEDITAPKNGELKEKLNAFDSYQYFYALCKKNSGEPAYVISRKYGKYIRLTQVNAIEAFSYFLSNDERKDAWFFGCEGKKFIAENYMYTPGEENRFFYYSKRGLDGINFVKATDSGNYMAGLKAKKMAAN